MNIIAYCDGKNDVIDICNIVDCSPDDCIEVIKSLKAAGLIEVIY